MTHKIVIHFLSVLAFVSCTSINDPDPKTGNTTQNNDTTQVNDTTPTNPQDSTETPAPRNYGKIVGTWECFDINYENLMYGYFVLINDTTTSPFIPYNKALLCFNIEVKDTLPFVFGEKTIEPIEIPYDFTYKTVEYGEDGYVYFGEFAAPAPRVRAGCGIFLSLRGRSACSSGRSPRRR